MIEPSIIRGGDLQILRDILGEEKKKQPKLQSLKKKYTTSAGLNRYVFNEQHKGSQILSLEGAALPGVQAPYGKQMKTEPGAPAGGDQEHRILGVVSEWSQSALEEQREEKKRSLGKRGVSGARGQEENERGQEEVGWAIFQSTPRC